MFKFVTDLSTFVTDFAKYEVGVWIRPYRACLILSLPLNIAVMPLLYFINDVIKAVADLSKQATTLIKFVTTLTKDEPIYLVKNQ